MKQRQPGHFEQIALSHKIKHFLTNYKVNFCPNPYPHHIQFCNQYHSDDDKRRCPYKQEGFAYHPSEICTCKQQECGNCHNIYELFYHPLFYKTSKCNNYACRQGFVCYLLHDNQVQMLSRYQFFRFELQTFKTQFCPHRQQSSSMHELASCHYYHNESDKRRNPRKVAYSHVQCKTHCNDSSCQFAHNKIEQLYHPSRYKTKYCQSYVNKKMCQYNEYCSFAHSDHEIKIELLHLMDKDQYFYDYKYKTVWCPYTNQHDRGECPYAHNFQDYRRDPKKKLYTPDSCPNWTKGQIKSIQDSGCPLRMECPKSHGWLEKKFHPDRKKWEAGESQTCQTQPNKPETTKIQKEGSSFVLGAPFFQQRQKGEKADRSQSSKNSSRNKTKEKRKLSKPKQKWFNFSFFLPDNESFSGQNNQNESSRTEFQACWEKNQREQRKYPSSPISKQKVTKRHRTQYTKSLKQLLVNAGLIQKLSSIKMNQIKLLSLSSKEVENFDLSSEQKQQLLQAIKQYSKTHKPDKLNYTDSMIKLFRTKFLLKTLQKLRNKGVSQNSLQLLGSCSIEDLSFLQEQQKSRLPKILEEYADNRDFRQLKSEIEKHENQTYLKVRKSKKVPFYSFKE